MENTTSIMVVADRIKRHPMLADIPFETILSYTVDFIRIVGVPQLFEERVAILDVEDYRALLPCDYISTIQVKEVKTNTTFRAATDSFHLSEHKDRRTVDLTYKIQNSIIYTSLKEGKIEMVYTAIATDEDGYPLLPDNPTFLRALELYVKKQWFTIKFDMGHVTQYILNQTLQDYAFAVGACETDMRMLNLDKMESLTNSWCTLLSRTTEHSRGFRNAGVQEVIKVH